MNAANIVNKIQTAKYFVHILIMFIKNEQYYKNEHEKYHSDAMIMRK